MPAHETTVLGAPCWVDLMTSDPAKARDFYTELFGWTAGPSSEEFGGYFEFARNGVRIAGGMTKQEPSMPDVWSVYLLTRDAEKTVAAATAHGGGVIAPVMAVADLGTMAVVTDPGSAVIGMWQPNQHHGFGLLAEPGAPGWFELLTRDYDASIAFYKEVFGWKTQVMSDTPEFRYTVLTDDMGEQHAGVMDATSFLPDGVPAHWGVYFAVEDTDAALALTVKLGGAIVQPAEDTPYGRLAIATDATGAMFKLVGKNTAESAGS